MKREEQNASHVLVFVWSRFHFIFSDLFAWNRWALKKPNNFSHFCF